MKDDKMDATAEFLQKEDFIEHKSVYKILFVCSSNVCRSPYCEFELNKMIGSCEALKGRVTATSAGVVNRSRSLFSKGRERLLEEGFYERELNDFVPRYKDDVPERFREADVIIGMSRAHRLFVPRPYREKYVTLSEAATGRYSSVPDPFLSTKKRYNAAMDRLQEYLNAYFEKLKSQFSE